MAKISTATSSANVTITVTPVSATIRDDGTTELISLRVITDDSSGDVISSQNIRESGTTADFESKISQLQKATPAKD